MLPLRCPSHADPRGSGAVLSGPCVCCAGLDSRSRRSLGERGDFFAQPGLPTRVRLGSPAKRPHNSTLSCRTNVRHLSNQHAKRFRTPLICSVTSCPRAWDSGWILTNNCHSLNEWSKGDIKEPEKVASIKRLGIIGFQLEITSFGRRVLEVACGLFLAQISWDNALSLFVASYGR